MRWEGNEVNAEDEGVWAERECVRENGLGPEDPEADPISWMPENKPLLPVDCPWNEAIHTCIYVHTHIKYTYIQCCTCSMYMYVYTYVAALCVYVHVHADTQVHNSE